MADPDIEQITEERDRYRRELSILREDLRAIETRELALRSTAEEQLRTLARSVIRDAWAEYVRLYRVVGFALIMAITLGGYWSVSQTIESATEAAIAKRSSVLDAFQSEAIAASKRHREDISDSRVQLKVDVRELASQIQSVNETISSQSGQAGEIRDRLKSIQNLASVIQDEYAMLNKRLKAEELSFAFLDQIDRDDLIAKVSALAQINPEAKTLSDLQSRIWELEQTTLTSHRVVEISEDEFNESTEYGALPYGRPYILIKDE
ncbi:MAG: hypothetical protein AAFU85_13305 [Planctomycetota bacterium]